MKTKGITRIVSLLLVLSMLCGSLVSLTFGVAAEETTGNGATVTGPTIETTETWFFADNYYQSDWTSSTVDAASGQLLKADGTKDAISWKPGNGNVVALSEDGVLSFTRGTASYAGQMVPSKMTTDTLGVGPAYIAFDWYVEPSSNAYLYHNIAGTTMFFSQINWSIYYYQQWGTRLNPDKFSNMAHTQNPGWDSVEILFVPQTATGEICTRPDQVVATNTLYMRLKNVDATPAVPEEDPAVLDFSTFVKIADITNAKWVGHYSQLSELANSVFALDKQGSTLQIRNFKSGNLIPKMTGETAEKDESISTVNGYGIKEDHYESGWEKADDSNWFGYLTGDPASAGSANIYWQRDQYGVEKGGVVVEDGAMTVNSAVADNNVYDTGSALQFRPTNGDTGVDVGPVRVRMDYKWYGADSENSTGGFRFHHVGYDLFYVEASGQVSNKYGGLTYLGQMTDAGWYTFDVLMVPKDADGNICYAADATIAHTDLYYKISKGKSDSKVDTKGYTSLKHNDLLAQGFTYKKGDNLKSYFSKNKTMVMPITKSGCFTIANLYAANLLPETELYTVKIKDGSSEKNVYMPTDYVNSEMRLPLTAGMDAWIVENTTYGAMNISNANGEFRVSDNVIAYGGRYDDSIRIGGATMTLGSSMQLNMKVESSLFSAAPDALMIGVNSSAVFGKTEMLTTEIIETSTGMKEYYSVPVTGVRASDIARDLVFHLVAEIDGSYYIAREETLYSAARYATRIYAASNTTEQVKTLLAALLNYGAVAEAQRYGTVLASDAAKSVGITSAPAFPEDSNSYTNDAMTQNDKDIINRYVLTGATLTNGIDIVLSPLREGELSGVRVTTGEQSQVWEIGADGKITIRGIYASTIRNAYKLTFLAADGTALETANFVIGNFLETRRNSGVLGEKALAEAAIIYMMAVRTYTIFVNGEEPSEPDPAVTHTVSFDSAGGTAVASQTVSDGTSVSVPTAPTRDGYTFVAWTLNGVDYDFTSYVTEDITLVARWKYNGPYTVTFVDADGTELSTQTVASAATATQPADPERNGYLFTGWTLNGVAYDFATPVTDHITLQAAYTKAPSTEEPPVDPTVTHVVTFTYANGTGSTATVSVADGSAVAAPTAPVYNGYTFSHWLDANGNIYDLTTPVKGDIALKAFYTRDESVKIPAHTIGSMYIDPGHIEFWKGNDLALQLNIQATVTYTNPSTGKTSSVTTDVHYEGMDFTFYTDNPSVVTVSGDGTLTPVGLGTARVWAVIHQGGTQVHGSTDYVNYDPFVIHDGTVLFPTVVTIIEQPDYLKLNASDPENQQVQLPVPTGNRINMSDYISLPTGGYGSANIALWYNDATAALSITADDNMTNDFAQWNKWAQIYGTPISLMVPTSGHASSSSLWINMTDLGNQAQPHGHNHYANTFYDSPYITSAQAWNDSYLSKVEFEKSTGIRALIFAYPCGYNADFNKILYIAGRGVDCLPVLSYKTDYNSVDIPNVPSAEEFARLFDPTQTGQWDKFAYGNWLNFLEHGLGGRESVYEAFLPLAKERIDSGELWAAVFSAICQYGQERDTATILNMNAGADVITFDLTDKMNDMLFDHALTVKIKVDSTWTYARAYQNGNECDARIVTEGGETYVYVNAVPDKGEVKVVRTSIDNLTEEEDRIAFTPVDLGGVSDSAMTLTFTVDGTVWTNPYAVQNGNLLTATLTTYGGKTTLTVPFTVGGGEVIVVPVTDQYADRDSLPMYDVWQGFVTPDGTKPILISTAEELVMFSDYVRARGTTEGMTFRLTDDIDMSTVENFLPIGWLANHSVPFAGTFDGAEHTITNLTINQPGMNYVGLFGYVNGGTITRLTLENADVVGVSYVGGLVGRMSKGTINGVTFTGTVTAEGVWRQKNSASYVGGLVGQIDSSVVKNCEINATIEAFASGSNAIDYVLSSNGTNSASYVGGVFGDLRYEWNVTTQSIFDNIIFNGSVTAHKAYDGLGAHYVGGFGGKARHAKVTNSTVNADVSGGTYVGGFVGHFAHENFLTSQYKNCAVVGTVTGDDKVGGFAGFIDANNQLSGYNCYTAVTVNAPDTAETVGAVFGGCPYSSGQNAYIRYFYYIESLNPGMVCHNGTISTATDRYIAVASADEAISKLNTYAEKNGLPAWRLVDGVPSASYFPAFTVTFLDKDGNVIEEQAVGNTLNAVLPEAPFYEGYEFTGWSISHENITAPTTIQAQYKKVEVYTVTFLDKYGNTLSTQEINAGLAATAPEAPVLDRFTFTGWDKAFGNITEDTVVTAVYVNAFYVTFIYYDAYGVEQTTAVKTTVGETAKAPMAPGTETLRFIGWDTSFENVTADMTVRAEYAEIVQTATTMNVLQWNLSVAPNAAFFELVNETDIILYTGNSQPVTSSLPAGWAMVCSPQKTNGYGEQPAWQAVIFNTTYYTYDEAAGTYYESPPGSGASAGGIHHGAALAVPLIENSTNKQFVMTVMCTCNWGYSNDAGRMKNIMTDAMKSITAQFPSAAGIIVSFQAHAANGAVNTGLHGSGFYNNLDATAFVKGYDLVSHYEAATSAEQNGIGRAVATYLLTYMKEGQTVTVNTAQTVAAVDGVSVFDGIRANITFDKENGGE